MLIRNLPCVLSHRSSLSELLQGYKGICAYERTHYTFIYTSNKHTKIPHRAIIDPNMPAYHVGVAYHVGALHIYSGG